MDLHLWDLETGQALHQVELVDYFDSIGDGVSQWALSENWRYLATGHYSGQIRFWDLTQGKIIARLVGHTRFITSLRFSSDNESIFAGDARGYVIFWSPRSTTLRKQ